MNVNISKRNLLTICLAVLVLAIVYSLSFSIILKIRMDNFTSKVENVLLESPSTQKVSSEREKNAEQNEGYTLHEYGRKIGVFDSDPGKLLKVLDVYVATLPEADRKMLAKGISVSSKAELVSIMEDYTS